MIIFPLIIFTYIIKLIKSSFNNQENINNNLIYNKSQSNFFLNDINIEKYLLNNYYNNLNLEIKKIIQRKLQENQSEEGNVLGEILYWILDILNTTIINKINITKINTTDEELKHYNNIAKLLNSFVDKRINKFYLNKNCFKLLNYSYNAIMDDDYLLKKEFINEVILNIFLDKNDFISFDKCIQRSELFYTLTKEKESSNFHPIYFFSLINNLNNNNSNFNELKKTTLLEKNYFYYGICLLESDQLNKNNNALYCNEKDYLQLIKIILYIAYSLDDVIFETFKLKDKKDYFSKKDIFLDMIPFSILSIPLFIRIVLFVCKNKIIKKKRKGTIIPLNKDSLPSSSNEDNDLILKTNTNESSVEKSNEESEFQIYIPNWYKLFKNIFNFEKNFKELFNLSDKNLINNLGLSYTNALTGISMILAVFGQTFFILFNLPIKIFGIWSFYNIIFSPFYIILFIGLRYSPRVIFSCTGYTLSYKYLSFIAKKPTYYFGKFILLQNYKYFILIIVILFTKYSLYHLKILATENIPSWEIFLKKVLQKPESKIKIFLNFITFKILDIKIEKDRLSQDIFSYFWIPLNEIFFFIFGTILISLGYSYRIRIDYAIIILIILLYAGKIIYYYVYYNHKEEIYTTLYYYMFEYGKLMLNPLFNLSYFLIGMYFGLINYSIQRGINESDRNSDYSKIYNIKENNNKEDFALLETKPYKSNTNKNNVFFPNSIIIDDEAEEIYDNKSAKFGKDVIKLENNSEIRKNKKNKSTGMGKNNSPNMDNYKGIFEEDNHLTDNISLEERDTNTSINSNNIEEMPFLFAPNKIKIFMRKTIKNSFYIVILIFFMIIICIFIFAHYLFIWKYSDIDFPDKNQNKAEFIKRLSLQDVIPNKTLNCFYLIDIELVIFFFQFILFYLYMRGHEAIINGFFSHSYWPFFNKIYFSFILLINPIILYNFYESDNTIKLNTYTIYLYSFINIVIIFVFMIICYIYLELPLKKLFKYYIRKYEINEENKEDEDEDEDE